MDSEKEKNREEDREEEKVAGWRREGREERLGHRGETLLALYRRGEQVRGRTWRQRFAGTVDSDVEAECGAPRAPRAWILDV